MAGLGLCELGNRATFVDEEEALTGRHHIAAARGRRDGADVPIERRRTYLVGAAILRQRGAVKTTAEDVDPQQLLALLVPPGILAEQSRLERPRDDFGCRQLPHDHDRTGSMVDDLLAHRSEQQALETPEAASADDDQLRVGALREQRVRRMSLDCHRLDFQRRMLLFHACQRVVSDLLPTLAESVQRRGVQHGLETWRSGVPPLRHLPRRHDAELRFTQRGLRCREVERFRPSIRAVDTYDDHAIHLLRRSIPSARS
jgi:hypothetical protein